MATPAQLEAAIVSALVSTSGLSDGAVIWAYQNQNQPSVPYLSIALSGITSSGQDSILETYDGTRPSGQEFAEQILGVREVALQIQGFSSAVTNTDSPPVATAREILEQTRSSLLLPSVRDPLFAVGFVPFDPGPVNWIPEIVNVNFRGRATCDIRCRMPAQAFTALTGYIAGLRLNISTPAADGSPDIVIPFAAP